MAANVWRLTDAARDAIMDGDNRGTAAVQLTQMAIGSGMGPGGAADDARTALRNEVARTAVGGTTQVAHRIAVEAAFTPDAAVDVTEVGVFARVGAGGAEFLFAYWTDGGRVASRAGGSGDRIVLAGVFDLQNSSADVNVTLQPRLTITPPAALPPGTVLSTAAAAAPDGYLLCNGAAVSRATYAPLFAAIGTTFGRGDGAATFNVPDLRGRVVVGVGNAAGRTDRVRGAAGGKETHTLTPAELAAHSHTASTDEAGSHQHAAAGSHQHAAAGSHQHAAVGDHQHAAAGSHQHAAAGSHQHAAAGSHLHGYGRLDSVRGAGPSRTFSSETRYGPTSSRTDSAGSHTHAAAGSHRHAAAGDHQHAAAGGHRHAAAGDHQHDSAGDHAHPEAGDHTHDVTVDDAGGGRAHNNMPPFLALSYIIKT